MASACRAALPVLQVFKVVDADVPAQAVAGAGADTWICDEQQTSFSAKKTSIPALGFALRCEVAEDHIEDGDACAAGHLYSICSSSTSHPNASPTAGLDVFFA